jgi:uncharacterized protein (DUF2141 family)
MKRIITFLGICLFVTATLELQGQIGGYPGTALDFDGSNDYVNVGNDASLNVGNTLTIEVWVYPSALSGRFSVFSTNSNSSPGSFEMEIGNGNGGTRRVAVVGPGTWVAQTEDNAIILNSWNHIVYTRDGIGAGTHHIYVNGAEQILISDLDFTFIDNSSDKLIGSRTTGTQFFQGRMDEVRLWNIALDSIQIRENMHLPVDFNAPGLVSYWQFNEGTGTMTYDLISQNNGVLTNMAENDWVASAIPFGKGYADTQTEAAGTADFTNTGLSAFYHSQSGASVTVSRIDTTANIQPEADSVFSSQYWVVNRFGTGSFNADLTFETAEDLTAEDENTPSKIRLYKRETLSTDDWVYYKSASSVSAANNTATFAGTTDFSQFIVGRDEDFADITVSVNSLDFGTIRPGHQSERSFLLGNYGNAVLHVTGILSDDPQFMPDISSVDIDPNDSIEVNVTFAPVSVGVFTCTLSISSNDQENPEIDIILTGEGKEADGFPGYTLDFDGSNDYVSIGNYTSLNVGNTLTIEVWLKPDDLSTRQSIFSTRKDDDAGSFQLEVGPGDGGTKRVAVTGTGTWVAQTGNDALTQGKWNHIVYTRTADGAGTHKIYINGKLQSLVSDDPYSFIDNSSEKLIGSTTGLSSFFNGQIDELRLWNIVLDSIQIRENMHLPVDFNAPGLVSYWQFNNGSGNSASDYISLNHGVLTNMSEADWVASTIPFGKGYANTQTEINGTVAFANTGFSALYSLQNGASVTVTRIDTIANVSPDADTVFSSQYWVVNRYGTGSFNADLTFSLTEDISQLDLNYPYKLLLYNRSSASASSWTLVKPYDSVNVATRQVTFSNISVNGQFLIACGSFEPDNYPGTCLGFQHNNSVIIANDNALNIANNITIETWIKPGVTTINSNILTKGDISLLYWDNAFEGVTGKGIQINLPGTGSGWWEFNYNMDYDQWYHVAWTFSGSGELKAYINGDQVRTGILSPDITLNTYDLIISSTVNNELFAGNIDELRIWNVVRSKEEIRENMYLSFSGHNQGIVGYWQFNENSGNEVRDLVSYNHGYLSNVLGSTWVSSTIPFGGGNSESHTESLGIVNFGTASLSMYFTGQNGADITVTRIDTIPNTEPSGNLMIFDASYWVINRFGTGNFNADLVFTVAENLTSQDEANPFSFVLYNRPMASEGNWELLAGATSVFVSTHEISFPGITQTGQFIIAKNNQNEDINLFISSNFKKITGYFNSIDVGSYSSPEFANINGESLIELIIGKSDGTLTFCRQGSGDPEYFYISSNNFNGIDIGDNSVPVITDIDNNNRLDLIIGRQDGHISRYQQNSVNSEQFSLVTHNFSSIDVGDRSSPEMTDLDGDGLLDLLVGESWGSIFHYEQSAPNSSTFTLVTAEFNSISDGTLSNPCISDFNKNGLLDLVLGGSSWDIRYYEQDSINSTIFVQKSGYFSDVVAYNAMPVFADVDNDNVSELYCGNSDGRIHQYKQIPIDSLDFVAASAGAITSAKSYFISAFGLIADLHLQCPGGFEISISQNSGYSNELFLATTNGSIEQTVYLRFAPDSVKLYTGNITHSSAGSETVNLPIVGRVGQIENFAGNTLEFDGVDDYVNIGNNSGLNVGNTLTVEMWVKPYSLSTRQALYSTRLTDPSGSFAIEIGPGSSGSGRVAVSGKGTWVAETDDNVVTENQWNHIVYTRSGTGAGTHKIYVNGVLMPLVTDGNYNFANNSYSKLLGTTDTTSQFFQGRMDEVRIWKVVKPELEIRENMYLPINGIEADGLVAYWQFNDGAGMSLSDVLYRNTGTLQNMDESNWNLSSIPFGPGYSETHQETSGIVDFTSAGLSMNFISQNGANITVTRIDTIPNVNQGILGESYNECYWIIDRFGSGSYCTSLTFTLDEEFITNCGDDPENIILYNRSSSSDGNWLLVALAGEINLAAEVIVFNGISKTGQFLVAKKASSKINLLYSNSFNRVTNNFNSIDIGDIASPVFTDLDGDGSLDLIIGEMQNYLDHYEQETPYSENFTLISSHFDTLDVGSNLSPEFTDIDGDGLLDLLIGETAGNINHYEQESPYSTSFQLISPTFNSIDNGNISMPAITDIDGDGLLDLIVGGDNPGMYQYEQTALNALTFSLVTSNFSSISGIEWPQPTFTDFDHDGLLDLIVGGHNGALKHYEQSSINSQAFSLKTGYFDGIDAGYYSSPEFADINYDGLQELYIGNQDGVIYQYIQPVMDSIIFGSVAQGFVTEAKKYIVKADDISDTLFIECPEGFEISLAEHTGFTQELTLIPVNGMVNDSVFVRFAPVADTKYEGEITHTATGTEIKNLPVSGKGAVIDNFPGKILEFDGVDDYVEIADNNNFDITSQITIEAWIKVVSWKPNVWEGSIVCKEGSGSSGYMLRCGDNGKVNFNIGTGSSNEITTDVQNSLTLENWYHIAATYNGNTQSIYINGELVKEKATSGNILTNSGNLRFGSSPSYTTRLFNGKMEEVRIWNIALDSIQIRENMNLPLTGSESGLVGYWQFNDGSGNLLSDIRNGNAGILSNMDENDWMTSTIPFGSGYSHSETETSGIVDFNDAGVTLDYSFHNSAVVTVTRIDTIANILPSGISALDSQYWVINRYGTGAFNAGIEFTVNEDLSQEDENIPGSILLFTRGSTADTNWGFLTQATQVNAATNQVEFENISGFSQFIVCKQDYDGYPGTCLEFDGSGDNIQGTGMDTTMTQVTLEAWVNHSDLGNSIQRYITIQPEAAVLRYDGVSSGGTPKLHFYIKKSSGTLSGVSAVNVLPVGEWTHVAGTYDGADLKLYMNGELVASSSPAGGLYPPNGSFSFSGSGETMNGKLDELRVWNLARTQEQIRESMHIGPGGSNNGLVDYWQFNEGTGSQVTDVISGNFATMINMTNQDWVNSTIPYGFGASDSKTEQPGIIDFESTGLSMDFTAQSGAEITVSLVDIAPNELPAGSDSIFDNQYWVAHRYGSGSFSAGLTFILPENLPDFYENNPSFVHLYTRGSTADSNWAMLASANYVNVDENRATFENIQSFSQFIVGCSPVSLIEISSSDLDFGHIASEDSISENILISNTGIGSLHISDIINNLPDFTVNPVTAEILPGEEMEIQVKFKPLSNQVFRDTLTIFSDAANNPEIKVSLTGAADYPEITAIDFPISMKLESANFSGIDVGYHSIPAFNDLDGDGLLDLLIGEFDGNLNYYEQDAANSLNFSLVTSNFNNINVYNHASPTFTDLDGDGLLNLLIGRHDGGIQHYEQVAQNSLTFSLVEFTFNEIDVGDKAIPAFTDIDGDGLLDLLIGEFEGNLNHYEQDTEYSLAFSLVTTDFNNIDVGSYSAPAFTDLDENGLLDLFIGSSIGWQFYQYKQDEANSLEFSLINTDFGGITECYNSAPVFTDLDGNDVQELIIGKDNGNLNYYNQKETDSLIFITLPGNEIIKRYYIRGDYITSDMSLDCNGSAFNISDSETGVFSNHLDLISEQGIIYEIIYVKFHPTTIGVYQDSIIHSAGLMATKAIYLSGECAETDGFPGNALSFNNSDSYVDVGNDTSLDVGNTLTLEAWVFPENLSGRFSIFSTLFASKTGSFQFEIGEGNGGSNCVAVAGKDTWIAQTEDNSIISDAWNHIAYTREGSGPGTHHIYVNGAEQILVTNEDYTFINNNSHKAVGCGENGNYNFNGYLDEVRLWNVALDSVQIRENMHIVSTGYEPGLVSYWQFNKDAGKILPDYVGGNDGTLINMTNGQWTNSSIPFGKGFADSQTEQSGNVDFLNEGLSMVFNSYGNAEITVSRIDTLPNTLPWPGSALHDQYWVVNRYGNGAFDVNMTFYVAENLLPEDEANPSNIQLFTRGSVEDTDWVFLTSASAVSAYDNTATFDGISSFGQFILVRAEIEIEITLNLKVFLEGPFNGSGMNTSLNPDLPTSQPYYTDPWNYEGTEGVDLMPGEAVDWVLVELRDAEDAEFATQSTIIARQAGLLLNDGTIVTTDGSSPLTFQVNFENRLFVVIHHRNSLSILSSESIYEENDVTYYYDFTEDDEAAYSDGQVYLVNGYYGMYSGDINADEVINEDDINLWKSLAGYPVYYEMEDANLDSQIDNKDKNDCIMINLNTESQVPE